MFGGGGRGLKIKNKKTGSQNPCLKNSLIFRDACFFGATEHHHLQYWKRAPRKHGARMFGTTL